MGTSLSKTQLLTELRNEQAAWKALLDEIGEAHMTQPDVVGGWSIKDIVAHLTGWRRRSVRHFGHFSIMNQTFHRLGRQNCEKTMKSMPGFTRPIAIVLWQMSSAIREKSSSNW
jgi:Mycothiol maleylpyruvate isomerase N-terminal domain